MRLNIYIFIVIFATFSKFTIADIEIRKDNETKKSDSCPDCTSEQKDTEKATPNEDTNEAVDSTEEEDPIIEDVSRVDLTNLEVVSRVIQPNMEFGVECEHLTEEFTIYRYHALTASGKRVEVQIAGRKPAPFLKDVTIIDEKFSATYLPYLDCLPMDHPQLVQEVKGMLDPPSKEEYNFENLDANFHGETGHPDDVDRIVFGGQLKNGFFIEAGSVDAESYSDTLYFELKHNWTGLLVEAVPAIYQRGLEKHRKAYGIQTCLSVTSKPKLEEFDPTSVWMDDGEKTKSMGGIVNDSRDNTFKIQCMPLYSILLALGNPTVNWISLDIEGAEYAVLKTIPWDKVDIQALTVETHMLGSIFPGNRKEFISYMESVGYRHIKDAHQGTNDIRQELGTTDDLFVRNDVPLADEKTKLVKEEL